MSADLKMVARDRLLYLCPSQILQFFCGSVASRIEQQAAISFEKS